MAREGGWAAPLSPLHDASKPFGSSTCISMYIKAQLKHSAISCILHGNVASRSKTVAARATAVCTREFVAAAPRLSPLPVSTYDNDFAMPSPDPETVEWTWDEIPHYRLNPDIIKAFLQSKWSDYDEFFITVCCLAGSSVRPMQLIDARDPRRRNTNSGSLGNSGRYLAPFPAAPSP